MELGKLVTKFASVIIVLGLASISIAAQSSIGYVVDYKGTWVLNGSKTLTWGSELPSRGSIRHRSSASEDFITIVSMRAKVLPGTSRSCAKDDCSRVISLPETASSNALLGVVGAVFGSIAETVRQAPHRKRPVESRGGDLSEAVVNLADDKIDLSSVLKMQGEQYLRWRRVSLKEDSAADWTKPVKLEKTALVSGFQPGLYEISLVRSNGSNFEPVASAWILVATPADYEMMRASFLKVQELTREWGDQVRPETTRLFLQATLDNLARKAAK